VIAPGDLVVTGWDDVSLLYEGFWGGQVFDFIGYASTRPGQAAALLNKRLDEVQGAGGKVFFLGILDLPESAWNSFLTDRCGVPYGTLDAYRKAAAPLKWFDDGSTRVSLRVLSDLPAHGNRAEGHLMSRLE
jgi:hypothetical protein